MALDAFDREIKVSIDNLKAALLEDVGETKKVAHEGKQNTEQLKKLNDNLTKIFGDQFNKELIALKNLMKKVADCCEHMGGAKAKKATKKGSDFSLTIDKTAKSIKVLRDVADGVAKSLKKVMEGEEAIVKVQGELLKAYENSQKAMEKKYLALEKSREKYSRIGQAAKGGALGAAAGAGKFIFGDDQIKMMLDSATAGISKTTGAILEGPFSILGSMIEKSTIPGLSALGPVVKAFGMALGGLAEGMIKLVLTPLAEQAEFMSKASQNMFVSTGATITGPLTAAGQIDQFNKGMSSAYKTLEMFAVKMEDVVETGQRFSDIQKTYDKNFMRGIRDLKTMQKVSKLGLQTATLLGASADSTADLFADWHQKLGLSTGDLRSMQRGLSQVAMSTGLIGDQLIHVAKTANEFMKDMRLAGTLTTAGARSLIDLVARGEKTGTQGIAASVAKIFSQGRLRGNLSNEEQALAAVGGGGDAQLQEAITFGVVQGNKELEARFAQNLENWLRGQVGGDQNKSLAENMRKLSPMEIARISALTKNIFGRGAEELRIQIENLKEGSKSFGQRINDLNKSAKGRFSAQQAEFQKQQMFITTGNDLLDEFNKTLEDGDKNFGQALADVASKNKDFGEYLSALGTDASKGGAAIEKVLMDQATRMRKEAVNIGEPGLAKDLPTAAEISKAVASGDKAQLKTLTDKFADLQGALNRQAKINADPLSRIKQGVIEIEAKIKELVQTGIFQSLGFLTAALKNLQSQKFWESFSKGDIQGGLKQLGEFVKNIPTNIMEAMKEVRNLAGTTGFQDFLSAIFTAIAKALKMALETIGTSLEKSAPAIAKVLEKLINNDWNKTFENIEKFLESITLIKWKDLSWAASLVGDGIGLLVKGLGVVASFLGPEGALLSGLLLLSTRLGPLGLGVAIVYLLGKLKAISEEMDKHPKTFAQASSTHFGANINLAQRLGTLSNKDVAKEREGIESLRKSAKDVEDKFKGWNRLSAASLAALVSDAGYATKDQAFEAAKKNREEADRREKLLDLRNALQSVPPNERKKFMEENIRKIFPWQNSVAEQTAGDIILGNQSPNTRRAIMKEKASLEEKLKAVQEQIDSGTFITGGRLSDVDTRESIEQKNAILRQLEDLNQVTEMLDPVKTSAERQLKPDSIYVHDTHVEDLLKNMISPTMIPTLPVSKDVDEELKRRKAEAQGNAGNEIGQIEANTGSTAANTGAMVRILGRIGKMLAKRQRGGLTEVAGPDYPLDAFFDDILSTEWPNARPGRSVGLEIDYTDIS